jgi:thymidylate kinase
MSSGIINWTIRQLLVETTSRRRFVSTQAVYVDEFIVRAFFEMLDRDCSGYCVLGGYEELPARITSDLDFMVSREDFRRLPGILFRFAARAGLRLVQAFRHETTACYYILAQTSGIPVLFLHPDACSDYRRHGKTWLHPDDMLARRRRHRENFWIPAAADAFLYYLIKRVDKQQLETSHGVRLSRWYSEDPAGCDALLSKRLERRTAELVTAAARTRNWDPVAHAITEVSAELLASAGSQPFSTRVREFARKIDRWMRPTGLSVAVLGPDGSGKSSVIANYLQAVAPAFRQTRCFHLRPRLLRGSVEGRTANVDPHGQFPRAPLASTAKLLFLWADYLIGYLVRVRPALVRSTLVVFDRYYYDLLVDPLRFRFTGPIWLVRVIARFLPKPDLLFVLDAPSFVLQSRKQEVSMEETARQSEVYRRIAASESLRNVSRLVDVTYPLDQVVHQCIEATLDCLETRTTGRLHLPRVP